MVFSKTAKALSEAAWVEKLLSQGGMQQDIEIAPGRSVLWMPRTFRRKKALVAGAHEGGFGWPLRDFCSCAWPAREEKA